MGRRGENRLSFRRLKIGFILSAALCGAAIPPTILAGEPVRLLVTFLGLVAASILPSVSLVIGSMSGTGRSVLKIDQLFRELLAACRLLFVTLAWVGASFFLLVLFSLLPEVVWHAPFRPDTFFIDDAARKSVLVLVAVTSAQAVILGAKIPSILEGVLTVKHEIARFEAKKVIHDQAPKQADIREMFGKKEGFGDTVTLEKTN